jgi:predicted phage terminase large subunit-like protein
MGKNDWQALAVVGYKGGNFYILDLPLTRYDLIRNNNDETLARLCAEIVKKYKVTALVAENNGSQALFLNILTRQFKKQNIPTKIYGKQSTTNKIERITGLLGVYMQHGKVFIRRDYMNVYANAMQQFEHFPKAAHDDAPDATNMAIDTIIRSIGV